MPNSTKDLNKKTTTSPTATGATAPSKATTASKATTPSKANANPTKFAAGNPATPASEDAPGGDVRRRVPRRVINQKIGLLAAGQYVADAIALEIGEGGMLINTDLQLTKGQKIVVTIRIRGVLRGVMLTSVVYLLKPKPGEKGHRYGLQFENIDFDVKRKIRNFVASGAGQVAKPAA